MDHDLELFIPILEILENGYFQLSPILEIVDRTIHIPLREAPLPSTLS